MHPTGAGGIVPRAGGRRHPAEHRPVEHLAGEADPAGVVADHEAEGRLLDADAQPRRVETDAAFRGRRVHPERRGRGLEQDRRRAVDGDGVVDPELHAQHTRRPRGEPHRVPGGGLVLDPHDHPVRRGLVADDAGERHERPPGRRERRRVCGQVRPGVGH